MINGSDGVRVVPRHVLGCGAMVVVTLVIAVVIWLPFGLHRAQIAQLGPLQEAAYNGDLRRLEALLNSGYQIDGRCDFRGWTALHAAANRGQVATAEFLLDRGAKVDLRDRDGFTPLHVTGSQPSGRAQPKSGEARRNEVARLLIDSGADVNARTNYGNTPLHCAVISRNAALVRLLLDGGADQRLRNSEGQGPTDYLRGVLHDDAVVAAFERPVPSTTGTDRD